MKRGVIECGTLKDAELGVGVAVADWEEEADEEEAIEEADATADEEAVAGRADEGTLVGQWV